jgi:hypothetical protein
LLPYIEEALKIEKGESLLNFFGMVEIVAGKGWLFGEVEP